MNKVENSQGDSGSTAYSVSPTATVQHTEQLVSPPKTEWDADALDQVTSFDTTQSYLEATAELEKKQETAYRQGKFRISFKKFIVVAVIMMIAFTSVGGALFYSLDHQAKQSQQEAQTVAADITAKDNFSLAQKDYLLSVNGRLKVSQQAELGALLVNGALQVNGSTQLADVSAQNVAVASLTASGRVVVTGDVQAGRLIGDGQAVSGVNAARLGGLTLEDILSRIQPTTPQQTSVAEPVAEEEVTPEEPTNPTDTTNFALLNGNNIFTGTNIFSENVTFNGINTYTDSNVFNGSVALNAGATIQGNISGQSAVFSTSVSALSFSQNGNVVCDSSGNCPVQPSSISLIAFLQNGNTFGTTAVLGTSDNQDLVFKTNDVNRLTISQNGAVSVVGTLTANAFIGNGNQLNNLNAANITSGIINDARLSPNLARLDVSNTFLGANTFSNDGNLFTGEGSGLRDVNAVQLEGQNGAFYRSAANINSGILDNARLSSNVTLQGNTFNGASELVQLTASGALPALDGTNLSNVNAALLQGYAASYFTDAANLSTGVLLDARLSANVPLKDTDNTFIGANTFAGLSATSILQNGNQVCDTSGNCVGSGGSGGAIGGSGTPGTIAMFDSSYTLKDSLLSQAATTVTVAGTLNAVTLQGDGSFITGIDAANIDSGILEIGRGGTGVGTFVANGLLFGNGTGALQVTSAGVTGECLVGTTNGAPRFINCIDAASGGPAGGDLSGTYPNPRVSGLDGTPLATNAITAGDLLIFNGSTWSNAVVSGDITVNGTGVATINTGVVTNDKLTNSAITVQAGAGLLGGGSVALGQSTALQVIYGDAAGTAVEGNTTLTCAAGNGNLIGGGNSITLGAGGACDPLAVTDSPSFSSLTLANALSIVNGGTGANTAAGARSNLGAAASGANSDITSLDGLTSAITAAQGGTGINGALAANGAILIGNGSGYTLANIAQGSGISITNGSGSIEIAIDNTVCTTVGNCAGAGNGITGVGTVGTIAVFTANGEIGDSLVSQSGGVVTVAGTLSATALQGDGSLVTNLNADNIISGTIASARLAGDYSGITGVGFLTSGSIGGSFGAIATTGVISTSAALQGNSLAIGNGAFSVNASGVITGANGITSSGAIVLSSLGTGVVLSDASGQLYNGQISLGSDTTGDYVATLGTLTGLSTTGNTGAGSTPSLSVTYGAAINTAAQGNTALSITGSGNLTGSATGTAGGGFTTNTLTVIDNPTFAGMVTANGGLLATDVTFSGSLTQNGIGTITLGSLGAGLVQTDQNGVVSSSTLNRNSALLNGQTSVANGGTGANTASGARNNLGAAANGANTDITSLDGLTTAITAAQGGTGLNGSAAANGALLIGNGSGYTLANLTQGSGISITSGSGSIDIAVDGTVCTTAGNCSSVAGGVTTSGGSTGTIALFTGTQQIGDSILTQSGTVISVAGLLSANALQGDGAGITGLNADNLASGTVASARISGDYSGIAGVGALLSGSIGTGFGAISTTNTISTSSALQGNTLAIGSGAFAVNAAGAITDATGITSSGSIAFSSLNVGGVVRSNGTGMLSNGTVALGTETTGNYIANFGTLTGLTATGAGVAAALPNLSVTYGASANTAAQGNTALSFSGTGNLTGTVAGTAGGGITSNTLNIVANPTFAGLVSANGGLSATNISLSGDLTQDGSGTITLSSLSTGFVLSDANGVISSNSVDRNSSLLTGQTNVANGGTGANTASGARSNLGAAASGVNNDITSLNEVASLRNAAGSLSVGDTAQALVLQGNASSVLSATDGAFTTSVGFATPTANVNYIFATETAGTYTICTSTGNCAGAGDGVTTDGGTANTIAMFTGSGSIGNSLLSQIGTTVSVAGTLSATALQGSGADITNLNGTNITSGTVGVSVGGTGTSSFTSNGVVFGNGTGALLTTVAGQSGECLVGDTGAAPYWANCASAGSGGTPGGSAGGDLSGTYPNPTVVGLYGTALSVSALNAGNVLLYDGINWVNQSVTGDVTVSAAGIATIADGSVTNAKLQNSSITVNAGTGLNGGGATALGSATTLSVAYGSTINTAVSGDTLLTCAAGSGNLTGGGNTLTLGLGGTCGSLSVIADPNFNSLSLTNALTIANGGTSAKTAVGARSNLGAAASGANNDITSISGLTTALTAAQGGTGVDGGLAANGRILIGNGNGYTLANIAQGSGISITNGAGSIQIAVDNTVCTTTGNCASAGGGVTTDGGTTGTIALFTGTQSVGNSIISQSGTTISVGGNLVATALQGDGSALTSLNANALASGTVASARISGAYSGITGVGSLNAGSIGLGFGSISTNNSISTSSTLQGNSLSIGSGAFMVGATGSITAATGITSSGAITLSSLNTGGVVRANTNGLLSTGNVALGSETTGNYVAALGTLTGLSVLGNSGPGSNPALSVTYGSAVNTAAQGNTVLSFNGTGNLTGGVSGTAGGGFNASTLTVINNPTFSGLVTANGGLNASAISFSGDLTQSGTGTITFGSLTRGIVQTDSNGVVSSATIDRNSSLFTGQTSVANGGTGATTAAAARTNLGAAASGTNADITSLTALTSITNSAALAIGNVGQALTLQGNASTVFTATDNGFKTTLSFQTPTANATYRLPTTAAGTYDLCSTAGNCSSVAGGVTTSGGTINTIALFTGSQTIGNSILSQASGTISIAGGLAVTNNISTGGVVRLTNTGALQNVSADAAIIASGTINDARLSANIARLDTSQTFTGLNSFNGETKFTNGTAYVDPHGGVGYAVKIGVTSGNGLAVSGNALFNNVVNFASQINSTVANGTAPIVVASSTKVANLNADLLDGLDSTAFAGASGSGNYIQNTTTQQSSANFNISGSGVLGGSLTVTGLATLQGGLNVEGNATVGGTLGVGNSLNVGTFISAGGNITTAGNLIEKSVTFTPTTPGWYRVMQTTFNISAGTVRATAAYDNAVTDLEFQYQIGGYGTGGSIQQTRYSSYNDGAISQARISSDGGANLYLDVYVSRATTPGPITLFGYGPSMRPFVASPVVGAVAGSTNLRTLTMGDGFRTSNSAIFAETTGAVGVGTATPGQKLDVQNGSINTSGNLMTANSIRLTATGVLQNVTYNGSTIGVGYGGTGATTAAAARTNLGAAVNGANNDITSLTSLTSINNSTALSIGNLGQTMTLQGNASTTFAISGNGNTTTLSFGTPTANVNYRFAAAAAGNYDICTTSNNCVGGGGGVTTSGGTVNTIALFTGSQTLGNSILSQSSGTINVGGALSVTGSAAVNSLSTTTNLTVGQVLNINGNAINFASGDARITGYTGGLYFGNYSLSNTTRILNDGSLQVLNSAGTPYFTANTSGSTVIVNGTLTTSGVVNAGSLKASGNIRSDADNSILSVDTGEDRVGITKKAGFVPKFTYSSNASFTVAQSNGTSIAAGNTFTDRFIIDTNGDASVLTGILNASNGLFTAGVGRITATGVLQNVTYTGNTIGIGYGGTGATTAAGARTNLGAAASGANGDITSLTALTSINNATALSVGNTGQSLTLQGNDVIINNVSGANRTQVVFQTPTANVTYRIPTAPSGNYDICTTYGNCAGAGGGITGSGTNGTVALFTGTGTIGNSILSQSSSVINIAGSLSTGGAIRLDNSGNLTNIGSLTFNGSLNSAAISNIVPFTVRGSGFNIPYTSFVKIGSTSVYVNAGRGLTLTILNRSNYAVVSSNTYDTHASTAESDAMASAMNSVATNQIAIITSSDSWEPGVSASLKQAFLNKGLTKAYGMSNAGGRTPYAAIFGSSAISLLTVKSVEVAYTENGNAPPADIRGWLMDGDFTANGSVANAMYNPNGTVLSVYTDATGNVGVGTTNTGSYKLTVAGSANATTLYQNGNQVCDVSGNCGYASSNGSNSYIQNGTSPQSANFNITGTAVVGSSFTGMGEIIGRSSNNNQFRAIGGNYGTIFHQNGTDFYLLNTASGDQFGTWNSNRPLTVNNATGLVSLGNSTLVVSQVSGRVGIGTSSPSAKLDVQGDVNFGTAGLTNGNLKVAGTIEVVNGTSGSSSLYVRSGNVAGNSTFTIGNTASLGRTFTVAVGGNNVCGGNGTCYLEGNFTINDDTAGSTPFLIQKTTGNVGIGTIAPLGKLNVQGNTFLNQKYGAASAASIDLAVGDSDSGINSVGDGSIDLMSNNTVQVQVRSGYTNFNGTLNVGGTTRIDTSGNLINIGNLTGNGLINMQGTGTNTLSGSLNVAGSLKAGNTVYGNSQVQSFPANNVYYKIATLPVSSGGTYDHLSIEGVFDPNWIASYKAPFKMTMGNREGFSIKFDAQGDHVQQSKILAYQEADGTVSVYGYHQANSFTTLSYNITQAVGVTTYQNPTLTTSAPTGTLLFDSFTSTARSRLTSTGDMSVVGTVQGTRLISTAANGTAPLQVNSQTVVTNFNADLLDGLSSSAFSAASGNNNYIQNGTTPQSANFNVSGSGTIGGALSVGGNVNVAGVLDFGSNTRQMINLWGASYGIGVQSSTQYFRTDGDFQFYRGGVHSNTQGDAGTGGVSLVTIKSNGNLGVGTTAPLAKLNVQGTTFLNQKYGAPAAVATIDLAIGDSDTGLNSSGDGALDVYSNGSVILQVRAGTTSLYGDLSIGGTTRITNAGTLQNVAANASILTSGTLDNNRLDQRIGAYAKEINDWNDATTNGWYMGFNRPNAPSSGVWYLGDVVAHNNLWATQTVYLFTNDNASNTQTFRRDSYDNAGTRTWTAWYKLQISQAEQDARYAQVSGNGNYIQNGTTPQAANFNITGNGTVSGTLTVGAAGIFNGAITIVDNVAAGTPQLYVGDDTYFTDIDTGNMLGLRSAGNSALGGLQLGSGGAYLFGAANGALGIGKTVPLAKLDVMGELRVSNTTGFGGDFDNYGVRIQSFYSGNSLKILGNSDKEYFGVYNFSETALGLSGNVGIGTSAPGYKLDVQGNARITSALTIGDGTYGQINLGDGTISKASGAGFNFGSSVNGQAGLSTGGGNGTIRIDANGNAYNLGTVATNNTVSVVTSTGNSLFYGRQAGAGYSSGAPIFDAVSDNPNGASNVFFRGAAGGVNTYTVQANGNVTSAGFLQGSRFISTVATGTAPLQVASTTMVGNLNVEYLGGFRENMIAQNLRSGSTISASGNYGYTGSGIYWDNRMIIISNGNGGDFSVNGYYDINLPADGTVVSGAGGAGNVTVSGGVVPLPCWQSLYYILPIGAGAGFNAANLRIASYSSTQQIPSNWVIIAGQNCDNNTAKFSAGLTLRAGQSANAGTISNPTFNQSVTTAVLVANVANGTAPIQVNSQTVVSNLNADLLDGYHANSFALASGNGNYIQNGTTPQSANFNITGSGTVGGSLSISGSATIAGTLTVNGTTLQGTAGRNYFKDSELSTGTGLRVGAAWGKYGIYSESGDVVVGAVSGLVNLQNGAATFTGSQANFNGATVTSGNATINGRTIATGGTGTTYNTASIEIATVNTPRIAFHWPGVVASQLGMDASGLIRTFNNPGTGYERFGALSYEIQGTTVIDSARNLTNIGSAAVASLVVSGATQTASLVVNGATQTASLVVTGTTDTAEIKITGGGNIYSEAGNQLRLRAGTSGGNAIRLIATQALAEGNGTETAPFYSFAGSSGTGMYINALGHLAFTKNGSQSMCMSAGQVFIGGSTGDCDISGAANLRVKGTATGATVAVERQGDGNLINFVRNGTVQGDISVTNGTVSYNAFTGSHVAKVDNGSFEYGKLARLTGSNVYENDSAEPIYGIEPSAVANDPNILGAYNNEKAVVDGTKPNRHLVMAAGNGDMWIADNGTGNVRIGDPLISSGDVAGHAQRDPKTFAVSHVFGKAAETIDWSKVTTMVNGVKVKRISILFSYYDSENLTGDLQIQSLNVNSNALFGGDLTIAKDLNVMGNTTLQNLTVKGSVAIEGNLEVKGSVSVMNLTVNGHIITAGDTPQVKMAESFSADGVTIAIEGNDTSGTITVTTNSNDMFSDPTWAAAHANDEEFMLAQIDFAKAFDAKPRMLISPSNASAAKLGAFTNGNSKESFQIRATQMPTQNKTYSFTYWANQ